ncbi:MAG: hypothetical protein ACJAVK_003348 [Akkermansiaceae bacterium]|jgi:hypothetical protein
MTADSDNSDRNYPSSLSEARRKAEEGDFEFLFSNDEEGSAPWLFPGAGKSYPPESVFPLIVSPFPNRENRFVAGYSDMTTASYPFNELPPDISVFFE